jgi:phosphoglucomutase
VAQIVHAHWAQYGRNYYTRHDYEEIEADRAQALMRGELGERLPRLLGRHLGGAAGQPGGRLCLHDPVDGSVSRHQGLRLG